MSTRQAQGGTRKPTLRLPHFCGALTMQKRFAYSIVLLAVAGAAFLTGFASFFAGTLCTSAFPGFFAGARSRDAFAFSAGLLCFLAIHGSTIHDGISRIVRQHAHSV